MMNKSYQELKEYHRLEAKLHDFEGNYCYERFAWEHVFQIDMSNLMILYPRSNKMIPHYIYVTVDILIYLIKLSRQFGY